LLNEIPNNISKQAVKARGTNINEKINYLLNWYIDAANPRTAPTEKYQIDFLKIMGEHGQILKNLLLNDNEEVTKNAIVAYVPVALSNYKRERHKPYKDFYAYLTVELYNLTI